MKLAEAVEMLARTPETLRGMIAGVSEPWLRTADPGWWTPAEILGHLIHGEATDWVPRARIILTEGPEHPFEPFDREGFRAAAAGKDGARLVAEFATARAESLAALDGFALSDADLAREGTHPEFGRVTLGQLIATWATHDLAHVAQIAEAMAKRYREEVGPWRRYLPIVDRPEEDSG